MSRAFRKALSAASCAAAVTLALASCSDPISTAAPEAPEGPALSQGAAQDNDAVVPGEVLVSFKSGVDAGAKLRANGLLRKAVGYGDAFSIVGVNAGQERAIAAVLKNDPDVEWAEPNYIRTVDAIDSPAVGVPQPGRAEHEFNDPTAHGLRSRRRTRRWRMPTRTRSPAIGGRRRGGHDRLDRHGRGLRPPRVHRPSDRRPRLVQLGRGQERACNDTSRTTRRTRATARTRPARGGHNVGVAGVTGATANVKVLRAARLRRGRLPTSAIVNSINAAATATRAASRWWRST